MAAAGSVTVLKGYRTSFGNKRASVASVVGPASYANPGGQVIYNTSFGTRGIEMVFGGMSVSGTYYVLWQPQSSGPNAKAILRWRVTATNAEVANAVNLSAETVQILVLGG